MVQLGDTVSCEEHLRAILSATRCGPRRRVSTSCRCRIISTPGSAPRATPASSGDFSGRSEPRPSGSASGRYTAAGGQGPRYAQLNLCWAEDPGDARKTVHRVWPNAGVKGQLKQDLPTWVHFEQAATIVSEEDATRSVPCGPDIEPVVDSLRAYLDAGYHHIYLHQIGPDQDGFFRFWRELQPALRAEADRAD